MAKGTIIDIEGLDGSGKNTTTKYLQRLLESKGLEKLAEPLSFPVYHTPAAHFVENYLQDALSVQGTIEQKMLQASYFYMMDRFYSFYNKQGKERLIDQYNDGWIFLSDRYSASNILHQTRFSPIDELSHHIDLLKSREHGELCIPEADVVFFLNTPKEKSLENIRHRGDHNLRGGRPEKDILENIETFNAIYERIPHIIKKEGWVVIETQGEDGIRRTPEEIAEDIYNYLILNHIL